MDNVLAKKSKIVHENGVFISMSTKHSLENPGRIPLEIIEIQNSKHLDEIILCALMIFTGVARYKR